jgi:hypothetical protein
MANGLTLIWLRAGRHRYRNRQSKASLLVFALIAALAIGGCTGSVGSAYDATAASEFVPHQTTIHQAIAAMGPPEEHERAPDGSERLLYFYFVPNDDTAEPKSQGTYIYFDSAGKFLRAETSHVTDLDACRKPADATAHQHRCPAWLGVVKRRLSGA